ncbi:MAG: DUF1552 domain-containing protein, partial [Planctomycetia bacterium]|nr:DUF1552 domain-containing protein [Planctomycetia bacterium]
MTHVLSRRTVLRGLGTSLALPLLEAMQPAVALAAPRKASGRLPVRMAFLYSPNGMHMPDWTPSAEGSDFKMPWILEPLADLRGQWSVLSGLAHKKANANGDGGGDHARAMTTFLTGVQARKTSGADIHAGASADQIAARAIGKRTRLASLEIGAEAGAQSGSCDSGYSCAYSSTISWRSETQPVPKETDPRLIFERLFENGRPEESEAARARRAAVSRSVLDYVLEDANRLTQSLGVADQRKLDEYLSSVRELERRIDRASKSAGSLGIKKPEEMPATYEEHLRLLADLMVVAFQTDQTRLATFVFANEGSNRNYAFVGVPEGHHELSHHGNDPAKHAKLRKINRFHVEQLAYLLTRLHGLKEADGTLLDRCMIVYGSGMGDSNRHDHRL